MDKAVLELLSNLSQGNAGALKVIVELIKDNDESFLYPLVVVFRATSSKPSSLWMVYKDECDYDLQATKAMLKEWYSTSVQPLEVWLTESF